MRVTNEQLKTAIESLDTRLQNVEKVLMTKPNGNGRSLNPTLVFLIRWVIFPLIVVIGAIVGVSVNLPVIGS